MQGQTGSYVTTALVAAPASTGLTTLANVKDELDDVEDDEDSRLTRFINEESAEIARACNRVFGLATWVDTFRLSRGVWGEGVREANNPLTLRRYPLSTATVNFTGNTHASALVDGIASTVGLAQGMPVYGSGIPAGATISQVMPFSIVLSAPATGPAINVSFSAGLSVVETIRGVDTTLVYGTDFEVDRGSMLPGDEGVGRIYRLNELGNPRTWFAEKVTITYQAGYSLPNDNDVEGIPSLPPDLETACIRLVVGRYRARGRDPVLMERTQGQMVGTERYWVGATPGQNGPYPNEIMATIERYRVPVLA